MPKTLNLIDLSQSFADAEDKVLGFIDMVERDTSRVRAYGVDVLGYSLNEYMLGMEANARELIYRDPEQGLGAFADYTDAVLLVSERVEPHIPELGWIVDRHLGGHYAMGRLPVKDVNKSIDI